AQSGGITTLAVANDMVRKFKSSAPIQIPPNAAAYNSVKQSMTLNFALSLARVFDQGSRRMPVNRRDAASIPLLIRLVKQKRCTKALINQAKEAGKNASEALKEEHVACCKNAISSAIEIYRSEVSCAKGRSTRRFLRELRNHGMAHTLLKEQLLRDPTYNELFHLADAARDISSHLSLAIKGAKVDLIKLEEKMKASATSLWQPVFMSALD
ncbi:hypothetical protein, partial [Xanthomonas phaseoli]|uniref:AbiU2 domain-containing protein n=1 Tax=Xanthomonas phaseoli TaxID=1985254 RepID=UPI001ADC6C17